MGQVAVSITKKDIAGRMRITQGVITMSASYATNGDTVAVGDLGLTELKTLVIPGFLTPRLFQFDPVNVKIKAYSAVGTEVTNAADLSAVSMPFVAFGK